MNEKGLYFIEKASTAAARQAPSHSRSGGHRPGSGSFLSRVWSMPITTMTTGNDGEGPLINPIPGGVAPFQPFGVFIHHNPLNPMVALADISDPSQITDFDGFVGLTHIRGGGTGTDTSTAPPRR